MIGATRVALVTAGLLCSLALVIGAVTVQPAQTAPSQVPAATALAQVSTCPAPTITVTTGPELAAALAAVTPGDVIVLQPGSYAGRFIATVDGTPDAPIVLCGPTMAVLEGGRIDKGYVLHLDGISNWNVSGFSVRLGQKGIMADGLSDSVIEGLTVSEIGDEAIHLRRFSVDNTVRDNTISNTGLRKPKYGEGIYVGTAERNWCAITDCLPDKSDRNIIEGNAIFGTTSESVDIKEGTSGGVLRGNTFDGSSIIEADSWVDVKGNDWLIEGNTGTDSPLDGFQTHEILDGWGTRNVFRANTARVNGPGFGFSLTPERDNVVACSNTASNAGEGTSNVPCSG